MYDDEVRGSFEEEWPELARRLERFLAAKGVDHWLRADVIQETATRLYPRWATLDHSLPLWNLAATVAVRIVHNHSRKESRIELVAEPFPTYRDDVHVRGLQRAQLDKTRSALQKLNTDQRHVLLAEVGEALVPAGTRNRINVLRLRARAKLRERLGPWAPSAITVRLRSLRARLAQKSSTLGMQAPAMANSLVNVAMAATLALAGAAGTAVDPADPMEPARARLFSWVQLRDADLNPGINRRGGPPNLGRAKQPARGGTTGVPDPVNNEWPEIQETWHETVDTWHETVDTWHETVDTWHETEREAERRTTHEAEETWQEVEETWHEVEESWP